MISEIDSRIEFEFPVAVKAAEPGNEHSSITHLILEIDSSIESEFPVPVEVAAEPGN